MVDKLSLFISQMESRVSLMEDRVFISQMESRVSLMEDRVFISQMQNGEILWSFHQQNKQTNKIRRRRRWWWGRQRTDTLYVWPVIALSAYKFFYTYRYSHACMHARTHTHKCVHMHAYFQKLCFFYQWRYLLFISPLENKETCHLFCPWKMERSLMYFISRELGDPLFIPLRKRRETLYSSCFSVSCLCWCLCEVVSHHTCTFALLLVFSQTNIHRSAGKTSCVSLDRLVHSRITSGANSEAQFHEVYMDAFRAATSWSRVIGVTLCFLSTVDVSMVIASIIVLLKHWCVCTMYTPTTTNVDAVFFENNGWGDRSVCVCVCVLGVGGGSFFLFRQIYVICLLWYSSLVAFIFMCCTLFRSTSVLIAAVHLFIFNHATFVLHC